MEALASAPGADSAAFAIHLAGPRGVPCDQFPSDMEHALEALASEFAIVLDTGEAPRWTPLTDLSPTILRIWSAPLQTRPRPQGRKDAARAFAEGIASLSAAIDSGRARLNRDGTLNRRDRPALRDRFTHVAALGEVALDQTLDVAIDLLSSLGLLRQRDGRLEMSEAIEEWLASVDADPMAAIRWWMRRDPALDALESSIAPFAESGLPGSAAAELFLRRESRLEGAPSATRWNVLPDLLRQAVSIGFLETEIVHDAIEHVWPHAPAHAPRSERPWWCTSDFQLFLAPDAPLCYHRAAEFMGTRESSELVSRYRIVRESILAGAASPWGNRLPELIERLSPPRSVAFQLDEWLSSRRACLFETARIMKVPDPRRHTELASLDSFRSLVRETIPGWGFVIDPSDEPALRKLLATLGYDPPQDPTTAPPESWLPGDAASRAPSPAHEPDWQWPRIGSASRRSGAGSGSRYASGSPKELEFHDLLRLVEYAVVTECELDVVLKGQSQRALRIHVDRVDRRKEPASLEARLASTGERRDITIESIRKIALVAD